MRPGVSTEYLEADRPSWRVYYPLADGWRRALRHMIIDLGLACPFVDVERDLSLVEAAAREQFPPGFVFSADCQVQVLRTLFFRNKGAYLIGRFVNDGELLPFAVPILRDSQGRLYLDTVLFGSERIEALFNFARAYFMVDMDVPSAYVRFLTHADADQARVRAVHDARASTSRARRSSTATCSQHLQALAATASSSRPASRAW